MRTRLSRIRRSATARLVLVAAAFLVLPLVLYRQFEAAERDKRDFLLHSLRVQGALVARGLQPTLSAGGADMVPQAAALVEALGDDGLRVKLLFRPTAGPVRGAEAFFYVASSRGGDAAYLEDERRRLLDGDLLPALDASCHAELPRAVAFTTPDGRHELLTSLTPITGAGGCWVVITAYGFEDPAGAALARPFSDAPEVRLALAFYLLMAVLLIGVVSSIALGLRRFAALAHTIRTGGAAPGFTAATTLPELEPVAVEFDHMVATLESSAGAVREAAAENAHALKTPMATIVQSLEPLRPVAADGRPRQALAAIELAVERLRELIGTAMRLDAGIAAAMNAPRRAVDLSAVVRDAVHEINAAQAGRLTIAARVPAGLRVLAADDMLEPVIENLLDNAVDFTPAGGFVGVALERAGGCVRLAVEDGGPGVADADLRRIFERYYTTRPAEGGGGAGHQGIGLWVVRRNAEALGGKAWAEPAEGGGLRVVVELPAAP